MPELFDDPFQMTWAPIRKKGFCTRDPEAGPGTCYTWWEGCPDPRVAKPNCYSIWANRHAAMGHVRISATQAGLPDA